MIIQYEMSKSCLVRHNVVKTRTNVHMKTQFSAACLLNCYWYGLSVVCITYLYCEHCNLTSEGSDLCDPFTPEEWTKWSPKCYKLWQVFCRVYQGAVRNTKQWSSCASWGQRFVLVCHSPLDVTPAGECPSWALMQRSTTYDVEFFLIQV